MEMKNTYLYRYFLVMFICFTIDSVMSYFLPMNYSKENIVIIPSIALMMYLLMIRDIDATYRYFFGGICGLYYSIVYSNSLAIYILIYMIIAFIRSYIIKLEDLSFLEAILFAVLTIFVQEIVIYWLMRITNVTSMVLVQFLLLRVLPTLIVNMILFVGVYLVYNKIKIEVK